MLSPWMGRATLVVLVLVLATPATAAELGDIDGDGRVSFGDAFLHVNAVPPAPGSADFAAHFGCTPFVHWHHLLLFEALRRISDHPQPHFLERWPTPLPARVALLEESPEVTAGVLGEVHDTGEPRLRLSVLISTTVTLDALSLVVMGQDIDLRPAPLVGSGLVSLSPMDVLITGGLLVFRSDLRTPLGLEPGEHLVLCEVELPDGTPPGRYSIGLHPGSEVVTRERAVLRPASFEGTLEVRQAIADDGASFGVPPLQFAAEEDRLVRGSMEFRLLGTETPRRAGESFTLLVQAKVGRPVNHIPFYVHLDGSQIEVVRIESVFQQPGLTVGIRDITMNALPPFDRLGRFGMAIEIGQSSEGRQPYSHHAEDLLLEHFGPSPEWVDLARVELKVKDMASNGPKVLDFDMKMWSFLWQDAVYSPYCPDLGLQLFRDTDCSAAGAFWRYEPTVYHDATITVVDGQEPGEPEPPLPPAEADIRYEVSDAWGRPGDLVHLPVTVSTAVDLYQLRLVLGFDPRALELVGVEVNLRDPGELPPDRTEVLDATNVSVLNLICVDSFPARQCLAGFPLLGFLHGPPLDVLAPGVVLLDLSTSYLILNGQAYGGQLSWLPGSVEPVGTLIFRIRPDTPVAETLVQGVAVEWQPESLSVPITSVSAGYPILPLRTVQRSDVPAVEVVAGRVRVLGEPGGFLRGDANGDGAVDLSDAVAVLNALFQGRGTLTCADAADANDDGRNDISDAVHVLAFRFLGGPAPPQPYPVPGFDPTDDALDCGAAG